MIEPTLDYDDWFDDVMPDVPGCEADLAYKHIRDAVIEFCKQSKALIVDLDPIDLGTASNLIELVAPTGYEIIEVRMVEVNGKEIDAKTPSEFRVNQGAVLNAFYQQNINQIILNSIPTTPITGGVKVKASVKPTKESDSVYRWFGDRYFDEIADGAKARIMKIPKKPWTNFELFTYHDSKFKSAAMTARRESSLGFARQPKRTKLW